MENLIGCCFLNSFSEKNVVVFFFVNYGSGLVKVTLM